MDTHGEWVRRAAIIPVLGAACVLLHHAAWFGAFPQYSSYPPDQAGYLAGGRALFSGAAALARHGYSAEVVEEIRRWFDFLGIALLYGVIDAFRPNDLAFTRGVLACFNALAAVGAYSLARRLATPLAGFLALAFFVLSPAFPSGASRLYSDAMTGCLIVWSLRLFVDGGRRAAAAGLMAGVAMLVRVQLLPWVPLALLGLTALVWLLRVGPETRRRIRMGWLGLFAPLFLFALLTHFGLENRNDSAPKHNLPRYHYYAYGAWQYLESDGWEGPWRLKQDPFYRALVQASLSDPGLLESRPRQYVFAVRYLAARLDQAIPIILGNFYRIFDRPQNPEHRGFVDPRASILIHRLALVCAVVAAVRLWASGSPGLLAPLLILSLGAFHAMAWGWPRYAMPVLPALLTLSGMGLEVVLRSLRGRWRLWLAFTTSLALSLLAAGALQDAAPEIAWAIRILALLGGLAAVPFLALGSDLVGPARRPMAFAALLLCVVVFGNAWRDADWHEVQLALRKGDIVRQEISIGAVSLTQLRQARDRFVAVDLELRDPSRRPWSVTINGLDAILVSTIPPLPESIPVPDEGRAYPQWWTTAVTDEMIDRAAEHGVMVVEIRIDDPEAARLKADRFREQARVFEAPSLGDWPYAAGIKPEYDRDFRLVARKPLANLGAKTSLVRDGASTLVKPVARIRVFELDDCSGRVVFETTRVPSVPGSPGILSFAARAVMRDRGPAQLFVAGVPVVPFPIATFKNMSWTAGPFRLCYRDRTPDRREAYESRGIYLLSGPLPCAGPTCEVEVRFWPGMDDRPMSFSTELLRNQPTTEVLQQAAAECSLPGPVTWAFGRLVDGTTNSYPADRGRWRVARIY